MSAWILAAVAIVGFLVAAVSGFFVIPFLRKIHFGVTILEIGPRWHKSKEGTPIMGGFLFIGGTLIALAAGYALMVGTGVLVSSFEGTRVVAGLISALGFGFIGFMDDYIKAVKKRNLGLTAKQKLAMQFLVAASYFTTLYISGDASTVVRFPFLGQLDLGVLYYPVAAVLMVFMVNAVNLTDGIDGLCGSVTMVYSTAFMIIAALLNFHALSIWGAALAGACLGYLVWNIHPAKVFMGDVGSMFLGGAIVALGFGTGLPVLLLMVGFVYFFEAFSVVLQVISFKTTGKRIFKMSPIHHHFEMSGWSENKIVVAFSGVTLLLGTLGIGCVFGL